MTIPIAVPDRSRWALPVLLRERAAEHPDRPFLSFAVGGDELTYGDLDARTDAVASGFARLGIGRGDSVLMMLRNRLELVLGWVGANKLAAVAVTVNVDYRGYLLEHVANTVSSSVLVVEGDLLDAVAASLERLPSMRTVVVVGEPNAELGGVDAIPFAELLEGGEPPRPEIRPGDVACIQFTSGTSGPSKGAMIPHAHSHLLAELNGTLLGLDPESVLYTELPLFHVNSQMNMYSALLYGARCRIEPRFSASEWLSRLRASGATHTALLGVMLSFLLKQPERPDDADNPLRVVWAVPRPPELAVPFQERFGIEKVVTSYGTTENGMPVQGVEGMPATAAGRPVTEFYDVRVVDPDTDEDVPVGEVGEVVTRPRYPWCVTAGYVGLPERTVEAYRNLWFHTGDAAYFDDEGWFYFADRIKDRIRRRGENVASADVEHVLGEHEAVAESAVIAVKSEETGGEDEIKACIVLRSRDGLGAEEIWAWCEERLPYFAVPRYLEFLDELPKTPTSKIQKNVLREAGITAGTIDRGQAERGRGRR